MSKEKNQKTIEIVVKRKKKEPKKKENLESRRNIERKPLKGFLLYILS